jgi:hypothetical protein
MRKIIISAALTMLSLQGGLFAQNAFQAGINEAMSKSKTERTFNMDPQEVNIRDFVTLKNAKMILELRWLEDYKEFGNMDSLLRGFMNDIAFYKDSLKVNPTAHVRIDYVLNSEYSFKKIRFKQYNADGNIFMAQNGDISKLKFEQDTVRIIIQKSIRGVKAGEVGPCGYPYSIQATFLVGNYTDIDRVLANKDLEGVMGTLEKESQSASNKDVVYHKPMSIIYDPYYTSSSRLQRYKRLLANEYDLYSPNVTDRLVIDAGLGAGLIRNTLAPMVDMGLTIQRYARHGRYLDYNFLSVSVSPYYVFERNNEGNFSVKDNWFVNATIGSVYKQGAFGWLGKKGDFGVGYLFSQKGNYFKNTTMKVFTEIQLIKGLTVVPELIATDNFKQIFPSFTVRIF